MTDRTAILDRLRSDTEASRTAALAAAGNLSTFVQRICKGESLRDAEKSMRYPVGCGKLLLNVGLDRVAAFYRRTDMTELKITQADYDAAARFYGYREYGIVPASGPIVTAAEHFARHRIAAEAVAEQRGYQQGMEEAAGVAEDCMVMLSLGTPGEGPFTKQDRAADETRAAIATAIRAKAEEKKHGTR